MSGIVGGAGSRSGIIGETEIDRVYPSIGEQLDLLYRDKKNGTKKWEEAIDKVKSDHPKPTE